jgi:hypothetical protein
MIIRPFLGMSSSSFAFRDNAKANPGRTRSSHRRRCHRAIGSSTDVQIRGSPRGPPSAGQVFRLHGIFLRAEADLTGVPPDVNQRRRGIEVPQGARKARNQALFREVNERIAELAAHFEVASGPQAFVCECSQLGCTELLRLPAAAYRRLRDDPTTFLVLTGHEDLDHETVVERADGYLLIRSKPWAAAQIAREPAEPQNSE